MEEETQTPEEVDVEVGQSISLTIHFGGMKNQRDYLLQQVIGVSGIGKTKLSLHTP